MLFGIFLGVALGAVAVLASAQINNILMTKVACKFFGKTKRSAARHECRSKNTQKSDQARERSDLVGVVGLAIIFLLKQAVAMGAVWLAVFFLKANPLGVGLGVVAGLVVLGVCGPRFVAVFSIQTWRNQLVDSFSRVIKSPSRK